MNQLTISNITLDVIRKDIKNMHLAVYPPTGRIRIAAPLKMTDDAIRLFAISKLSWIKRQQRKYLDQERLTPFEYKERESHYFQGRRYLLRIIDSNGRGRIVLNGNKYIDMYVSPSSSIEQKKKLLNDWYRHELKIILPDMINYWEKRIGVSVNSWRIRLMKTKWGSCNTEKKNILLNLELAKKPIHCLEYILVHEMLHLIERHHNDRFLKLMDKFLPPWRKIKDELNNLPISHFDWDY